MRRFCQTPAVVIGDRRARDAGAETLFASEPCGIEPLEPRSSASSSPLGFTPSSRVEQLRAEEHALAVPTPENARNWLRVLTAEPHVAGTPADHKTAVFVRDKLREWGWKADIERDGGPAQLPDRRGVLPNSRSCAPSSRSSRWTKRPSRPTKTRPAAPPSVHSMAMAFPARRQDRSSTRITAGPKTTSRSRRWGSTSRARSFWPATAVCSGD